MRHRHASRGIQDDYKKKVQDRCCDHDKDRVAVSGAGSIAIDTQNISVHNGHRMFYGAGKLTEGDVSGLPLLAVTAPTLSTMMILLLRR